MIISTDIAFEIKHSVNIHGYFTCVWDVPPGHSVACWENKMASSDRWQTTYPAACAPECWSAGRPAAADVRGPVDKSPVPAESCAGSGHRRCGHMVYPGAELTAEGRCGTPNHHPLPDDSYKGGSPRRGESVHIQSKGPPEELRSPCLGPLPLPDCPLCSASATQYSVAW